MVSSSPRSRNSKTSQRKGHIKARLAREDAVNQQEQDRVNLERILNEKYECMHHEWFELGHEEAEALVFDQAPEIPKPDTSWYHPVMDNLGDAHSNQNAGSVLLTAKQEQALFIQYNYCRHRAIELKTQLLAQETMDSKDIKALLSWHGRAEAYRSQIADTNLALVLAMAKRSRLNEMDFADLVSEGNMALLRAVDKFDVTRGFKFSTYACRAILKAFSRNGIKFTKYRQMFPAEFDPALEKSNFPELRRQEHEEDCVEQVREVFEDNRAELSEIETQVIEHRFAINKLGQDARQMTLEEVGQIIGVTKERVRQIQNKALKKMRGVLEEVYLN
jgi:RNA polymerase primary sigma factor